MWERFGWRISRRSGGGSTAPLRVRGAGWWTVDARRAFGRRARWRATVMGSHTDGGGRRVAATEGIWMEDIEEKQWRLHHPLKG